MIKCENLQNKINVPILQYKMLNLEEEKIYSVKLNSLRKNSQQMILPPLNVYKYLILIFKIKYHRNNNKIKRNI